MAIDHEQFTRDGRPRRHAPRARAVPVAAAMPEGAPHFAPGAAQVRALRWLKLPAPARLREGAGRNRLRRARLPRGGDDDGGRGPVAQGFPAWIDALAVGVERLQDIALDRAISGTPKPIFYRNEQVGEERRYNDRLLNAVLRQHDPAGWGEE